VGETSYWDVARRRWQVVVAFAQLGVGIALVASTALDSARPIRDIVIGFVAGLAAGLIVVRPVEQIAAAPPVPARGRHWRGPGGRHARRQMVVVEAVPWPEPQLAERPTPTFARPGRG
jgi:hypothetical protein